MKNSLFSIKAVVIVLVAVTCGLTDAKAQLKQSTWLVGGSASFRWHSYENTKENIFIAEPKVGYIFLDKLVGGMICSFQRDALKLSSGNVLYTAIAIGPFGRYYLLTQETAFNILTEAGYELGRSGLSGSDKNNHGRLWIGAGATYFLNNIVALELLGKYERRSTGKNFSSSGVIVGVGFQIYLERAE